MEVENLEMDHMERLAKRAGTLFHTGIIVVGIAIATAGIVSADGLGDYPQHFINDNGEVDTTIVVGDQGNSDMVAAANIAGSLSQASNSSDVAIYSDSNIDDRDSDMVLIGGPDVNDLTMELAENGETWSPEEFGEDKAVVQLVEDAFVEGNTVLVVAGYSSEETMKAANYISQYEDHQDQLRGEEMMEIDTTEESVDQEGEGSVEEFDQLLD